MVSIPTLVNIFSNWIVALQDLWSFLNTNINYFLEPFAFHFPPISVIYVLFQLTGIGSFTFLEFMLGSGLAIYVGYQFVTWILNLLT